MILSSLDHPNETTTVQELYFIEEVFQLTVSHMTNFRLFQTVRLADDNCKLVENGRKFFKRVENTGKRRNCSLCTISPFPTVLSKDFYCQQGKSRACLGKGYPITRRQI